MEKIYRVKINSKGMPNFSTAKEIPSVNMPIQEKCCFCPHCENCDVSDDLTIAGRPQEWIPCSERMPDKSGEYLAYSIISFVPDHIGDPNIRQDTTVAFYSRTFNEWIGSGVERVLAWRPKPEPWRGADDV